MKTCSKCKESKDEAEFAKNKNSNDGLDSRCKSCMREYQQTDVRKEYQKAYLQTATYKEYQKAYRQTDTRKASQKAYYLRRKAAASAGNAGQSSDTQTSGAKE